MESPAEPENQTRLAENMKDIPEEGAVLNPDEPVPNTMDEHGSSSWMPQQWVDTLHQPEQIPPGLEALAETLTRSPPLFDQVGALLGLKQEVGLQGRSFQGLSHRVEKVLDTYGTLQPKLEASQRALAATLKERWETASTALAQGLREMLDTAAAQQVDPNQWREALEEERIEGRVEALLETLEVRDRLWMTLSEARVRVTGLRGVRGWLTDRGMHQAVVEGLVLTLARFDELLARNGIREVDAAQDMFDPHTMHAIDIEERTDLPDGHVLEIIRPGYLKGTRLLRSAEVRVSRHPA